MYQYYYLGVQDQASSRSVYTLVPHGETISNTDSVFI